MRPFERVHVDFGTGDGAFAYRAAREHPRDFVIGLDADAASLREMSHRASRKPARGGLPNVMFGRMALAEAPGELAALAHHITVLLPWGSLLRAVAAPEPEALRKLAALGRDGAELRCIFGYDPRRERRMIDELGLPPLDTTADLARLETTYRAAGLDARARHVDPAEVAALPTTWAKKLTWSGHTRSFVELVARVGARLA